MLAATAGFPCIMLLGWTAKLEYMCISGKKARLFHGLINRPIHGQSSFEVFMPFLSSALISSAHRECGIASSGFRESCIRISEAFTPLPQEIILINVFCLGLQ
jgi:hypothetical protein